MITKDYLNEVAFETYDKIAKVKLNDGEYEITQFNIKQTSENIVQLEYTIPLGSVTEVRKIELMSRANEVISRNDIYIPITSTTIIKHHIYVKDGEK